MNLAAYSSFWGTTHDCQTTCLWSRCFLVGRPRLFSGFGFQVNYPCLQMWSDCCLNRTKYCLISCSPKSFMAISYQHKTQYPWNKQANKFHRIICPRLLPRSPGSTPRIEPLVVTVHLLSVSWSEFFEADIPLHTMGLSIRGTEIWIPALCPNSFALIPQIKMTDSPNFCEPQFPPLSMEFG